MKRWTVGRTWWELTKLVLTGRGRYDLYLRVDDLPTAAQNAFDRENWGAVSLYWTDSQDHSAVLAADPEDGDRSVEQCDPDPDPDPDAVIAELERLLGNERLISERLDGEVKRLVQQVTVLGLRADVAIAEAARLRADTAYVAAARCECGGDAELHWRTRAAAAEAQAGRDRANALVLTDRLADRDGREVSAGYVR